MKGAVKLKSSASWSWHLVGWLSVGWAAVGCGGCWSLTLCGVAVAVASATLGLVLLVLQQAQLSKGQQHQLQDFQTLL